MQRRVLFLHFFQAKTAECIWAQAKNAFGLWFLPYGASVFDTKSQLSSEFFIVVLEGASCANAFCLLCKMRLGMLLLILGPFSGILRNGDYGSKRVQILYIDVLMRRKT